MPIGEASTTLTRVMPSGAILRMCSGGFRPQAWALSARDQAFQYERRLAQPEGGR